MRYLLKKKFFSQIVFFPLSWMIHAGKFFHILKCEIYFPTDTQQKET